MHFSRFFILFIFLLLSKSGFSQAQKEHPTSLIYLDWANDLFVQTDYYFSNGIELGYVNIGKKTIKIKHLELQSFNHFSIVQDFFTPTNINTDKILFGDRPYAAYLVGSYQKHLYEKEKSLYFNPEIMAGILGSGALGRHLQTLTHDLSPPSKPPKGWSNQVVNDLALNLNGSFEKGIFKNKLLLVNTFSKARLGTLYTDLSVGGRFRMGKYSDFFQSYENLSFEKPEKWQLFLELKPYAKVVGYNATLQGGVFNGKSPYTIAASDINRVVGVVEFALVASYKNVYLNTIFNWNSKEFKTASSHQWITVKLRWAF